MPSLYDKNPVNVKLGLQKIIKEPDFDFSKVYKRDIFKIEESGASKFSPCYENRPEVEFDVLDQIVFEGIPKRPTVITDFADM